MVVRPGSAPSRSRPNTTASTATSTPRVFASGCHCAHFGNSLQAASLPSAADGTLTQAADVLDATYSLPSPDSNSTPAMAGHCGCARAGLTTQGVCVRRLSSAYGEAR